MSASDETNTATFVEDRTAQPPRVEVMRHVRDLLRRGAVKPGEPIPSERSLARELKVHRATVRRALAVLEEEGLFRTRANGEKVVRGEIEAARGAIGTAVAVFMPDITDPERARRHTQSGWAEVIGQGAIAALRRSGGPAMILPPDQLDRPTFDQFRIAPPAGVIVADLIREQALLDRFAETAGDLPCPVVVYGGHPRWAGVDRIASDHAHGCAGLYDFLWRRGRRRILLLMPATAHDTRYWIEQRIAGYEQATLDHGSAYQRIVHLPPGAHSSWRPDGFEQAARFMLGHLAEHLTGPEPADAIMCASDGNVFAVAAACRLLRREPDRDIEIVGYDNYWRDAVEQKHDPYRPPATVDKRNETIGAEMVRLLQQRMAGRLDPDPQVRIVEPQLVVTDQPDRKGGS